jgi:decaprenylphospho-beta-D-ribofuranose 2-oxidase
MIIQGWGCYTKVDSKIFKPKTIKETTDIVNNNKKILARGLGRSYGDSANNDIILDTTCLNNILEFDPINGIICCESGVSIKDINEITIPSGWFISVTPGSSYITLGGAIASDIHGKNHHHDGTISEHIFSLKIMLGDGEIVTASKNIYSDLYRATCGGMGLTGIIISAIIKLRPIYSNQIVKTTIKTSCLEETFYQFEKNFSSNYSVAWVDCLTQGKNLGRSLLFLGEHKKKGKLDYKSRKQKYLPAGFFSLFLNKNLIKIFNTAYYFKNLKKQYKSNVLIKNYFYPLDFFLNWNFLYGKKGFIQYQFVIPKNDAIKALKDVLKIISEYKQTPFLGVLKLLGPENKNYLSFPLEGYTLAIDFKINHNLFSLINILDKKIISHGGRIYLTKDALMSKEIFRMCYPKWNEFQQIREKYKAIKKFSSYQSIRLGL